MVWGNTLAGKRSWYRKFVVGYMGESVIIGININAKYGQQRSYAAGCLFGRKRFGFKKLYHLHH
jgi:hypothetical protein